MTHLDWDLFSWVSGLLACNSNFDISRKVFCVSCRLGDFQDASFHMLVFYSLSLLSGRLVYKVCTLVLLNILNVLEKDDSPQFHCQSPHSPHSRLQSHPGIHPDICRARDCILYGDACVLSFCDMLQRSVCPWHQ